MTRNHAIREIDASCELMGDKLKTLQLRMKDLERFKVYVASMIDKLLKDTNLEPTDHLLI